MSDIFIRNTIIVNHNGFCEGDVHISRGKIAACGHLPTPSGGFSEINARGLLCFPGGIDPHVHMSLPTACGNSSDDFESGSLAALSGGTTTLIDFVTPQRNQPLEVALKQRKSQARRAFTDISLHMGLTSLNNNTAGEIEHLIEKEGITSFKTYLAYRQTIGVDYKELESLMNITGSLGGLMMVHCEQGEEIENLRNRLFSEGRQGPSSHPLSRPPHTEYEAVNHVLQLSGKCSCPLYLVHLSTAESVSLLRSARTGRTDVAGETCPHYLLLDEACYFGGEQNALRYVMSPPLRNATSRKELWNALSDSTLDIVSTDHCPFFTSGQKSVGLHDFRMIPNGVGSVEYRSQLLFTYGVLENTISPEQFVALTSTNAALIFGLYPSKGLIAPGSDADVVLWNPQKESVIEAGKQIQRCDENIYEGFPLMGGPEFVIRGGHILVENGKIAANPEPGKFIKRKCTSLKSSV